MARARIGHLLLSWALASRYHPLYRRGRSVWTRWSRLRAQQRESPHYRNVHSLVSNRKALLILWTPSVAKNTTVGAFSLVWSCLPAWPNSHPCRLFYTSHGRPGWRKPSWLQLEHPAQ